MRQAAAECGIQSFAVAPSRLPSQSRYALHFETGEAGMETKLDCYRNRLRSRGLRSTLALGGGDLRTDDGLLFARINEACDIPWSAMITQGEGAAITIYGSSGLSRVSRQCATERLRASGRFRTVAFSDEQPPAPPSLRF